MLIIVDFPFANNRLCEFLLGGNHLLGIARLISLLVLTLCLRKDGFMLFFAGLHQHTLALGQALLKQPAYWVPVQN